MGIADYIDHTILAANATRSQIEKLCQEAMEYGFASVCVNSCWAAYAESLLSGSSVHLCCVVGFPLGAMSTAAKAFETERAVMDGADEIDMVINIGWLKSGMTEEVLDDIKAVRKAADGKILKVIIETCLLSDDEKKLACRLSSEAGADFVKTSTGFSLHGATVEDVALMRASVPESVLVKASGGIRNYETAKAMIDAGAMRIGASAGVNIVKEELERG